MADLDARPDPTDPPFPPVPPGGSSPDVHGTSGTLTTSGDAVSLGLSGDGAVGIELTGTWTGTVTFEGSVGGSVWVTVQAVVLATSVSVSTATANGTWVASVAGLGMIRVRASAAMTGTVTVKLLAVSSGGVGGGGGGGGGATTTVDGGNVALGSTTDAGIITDSNGTAIGFLRGAIKMWLNFLARFPAALGGSTSANSLPVVLSSDGPFAVQTGSITEAAPATDTGSSGLNGRLQRIAQRITSLITALGSPFQAGGSIGNTGFTAVGTVAHGTANSGAPITEGRVAIAHGTNPTAVAAAARTDMYANRAGVPFFIGGHPNVVTVTANLTAAQTDLALATVAGGLKIVVTSLLVTASFANTVNVSVTVGFGTTNTPTLTANTPVAGVVGAHPNVAPGSGFGRGSGTGILGVGADGEDLRVTNSVPTGGSIDVMFSYYTIES